MNTSRTTVALSHPDGTDEIFNLSFHEASTIDQLTHSLNYLHTDIGELAEHLEDNPPDQQQQFEPVADFLHKHLITGHIHIALFTLNKVDLPKFFHAVEEQTDDLELNFPDPLFKIVGEPGWLTPHNWPLK